MTSALLIALRESFETALILCVMLSCMEHRKTEGYDRWIWAGLLAGAAVSVLLSVGMSTALASMPAHWRSTTEAVVMIAAAVLIGWMTVWMASQSRSLKREIEREVSDHLAAGYAFGLFLMSFISTVREGTEMVILIHAVILSGVQVIHALSGALAGISGAAILGFLLFRGLRHIPLRAFFATTGVILLLLGTGLTMRGIGMLGAVEHTHSEAHEESLLDEVLETFIGTDELPTPLQAGGGLLYIGIIGTAWARASRRRAI